MNTFRTPIPAINFPFKISHKSQILCIGSCFTENIGSFLSVSKFNVLINPFGIIYNPISICQVVDKILDPKPIQESELVFQDNRYYHWDFHGDYSSDNLHDCLNLLNNQKKIALDMLKDLDVLFITLGTANAFRHLDQDKVVANCHKVPNSKFERIEIPSRIITQKLEKTITSLRKLNPSFKVVFTVSPVRHIRDGIINNQLSKARLIQSVHHLAKEIDNVFYFPSYELVMDDLRDYRFYKEDMIHINQTGLQYVWDYFKESFFDTATTSLLETISKLNRDLSHRAFHPSSDEHQSFLKQLHKKINKITTDHPYLNYASEIRVLESQLN